MTKTLQMKIKHLLLTFLLFPLFANAQIKIGTKPNSTQTAPVEQQTVKTVEGVTSKMLALISGPKNQQRNWEEFRNLFLPTAQFIALDPSAKVGEQARSLNIEEFIRQLGPIYLEQGFYESPIGIVVDEFNGIANAFQSYEAKNEAGTYQARGINSFQLVYLNERWWIASSTWANETATNKIPKKFINGSTTAQNTNNTTNTSDKKSTGKLGKAKRGKIILK